MIEPISRLKSKIVPKGWGEEEHIVSNDLYCLKYLKFKMGKRFSFHYHDDKTETWLCLSGKLSLAFFDLSNGSRKEDYFHEGDILHIPRGNPHQLYAFEDSVILEVSTPDKAEDNYRIGKGDSQK